MHLKYRAKLKNKGWIAALKIKKKDFLYWNPPKVNNGFIMTISNDWRQVRI